MAKKNEEMIEIKAIEKKVVELTIEGDSPLIVHAWSDKAKRMMLEAQQGKKKGKTKEVRNPVDEFINSLYWLTPKPVYADDASEETCEQAFNAAVENGAKFGFSACAIKQAGNSAAYRLGWVKNQTGLRGAYFIKGDDNGMIEIESDEPPVMREDMVRIGMGTADLRYRAEFKRWRAKLTIEYISNGEYSLENIINIINAGGLICGIGEWRPEKDGSYGMYHIKID